MKYFPFDWSTWFGLVGLVSGMIRTEPVAAL